MGYDPTSDDLIFGNLTPAFSFKDVNEIRGRIVATGKSHRREFDGKTKTQGDLLYWDGNKTTTTPTTKDRPVYDPVWTLQTDFTAWEGCPNPGEDGDDDGLRRLFITARSKQNPGSVMDAIRAACIKAHVRKNTVGDFVEVKRASGKGNINSPYVHVAVYYPADAPPEWASKLPEPSEDDEDGGLFN